MRQRSSAAIVSPPPVGWSPSPEVAVAATGALAVVGSFFVSLEATERGPVLCPFRRVTGLPCPGCGLTRSFVALSHGRPRRAFEHHPFAPVLFVTAIAWAAIVAIDFVSGRIPRRSLQSFIPRGTLRERLLVAFVATWLLWAIARAAREAFKRED